MKLFFKKILVFVFPLFLLVAGMDFYLRNMNSLYKEKARGLTAHAHEVEILILGNSHAARGVDPNCFTDYAFNIANAGQSIYFDKELTLQNLEALKKLKYVFISLDYHSPYFSSQRGERNIWSYYGNGIKHTSEDYTKADISPSLLGYSPRVSFSFLRKDLLAKWKFRNHARYLDFDTEIGVTKTDTLVKGFVSFSGTETNAFNKNYYLDRMNGHHNLINNSTEEEMVLNELDELITKLHSKGITAIFFSAPTFKDYNLILNPDIITHNNLITKKLCKKYNMEFWDYSTNNNFIQDEFFNPDHLNKKGAARFGKMLDSKLKLYNNESISPK
jgi:hypothetical protein